ncbi:MAG: MORN repeat-containing protein [Rhizobiaceae bacterium]
MRFSTLCLAGALSLPLCSTALAEDYWLPVTGSDCQVWSDEKPDGDQVSWSGKCTNGKISGKGMLEWKRGSELAGTYDGWMDGGKFNGFGELRLGPSGKQSKLVGFFEDGEISGGGIYTDAKGNVYEGGLQDGEPHGSGYASADGEEYVGGFQNGKRQGIGYLITQDDLYIGEFESDQADGSGVMEDSQGGRYHGQFVDGKPHGHGTYITAKGAVYQGRFAEGEANGPFMVTSETGAEPVMEIYKNGEKAE